MLNESDDMEKEDLSVTADTSAEGHPENEENDEAIAELQELLAETSPLEEGPETNVPPAMVSNGVSANSEPSIVVAQRCDLGVVRKRNEDSSFTFVSQAGGQEPLLPFAFCLVADGMGGHHAGHEASRLVSRSVAQHVLNRIYLPMMRNEATEPIRDVMLEAVEDANKALYTPDPEKEGGTTLTAALIIGRRLYLVHVGDSRAYLLHDGKLQVLTTDHSIVRRLQDSGQITAEEAATHPHRNLLYRAMTGSELEIDTFTRSLPKEGTLLLCSDGLWGSISEEDLQTTLEDNAMSLQSKANLLIDKAVEGGSTDNITAVITSFKL